eukprot:10495061-Alexandrium_andersonii.AAC.1
MQPRSWFADVCTVTVTRDLPDKPTAAERLQRWNQARAAAARRDLELLVPSTRSVGEPRAVPA